MPVLAWLREEFRIFLKRPFPQVLDQPPCNDIPQGYFVLGVLCEEVLLVREDAVGYETRLCEVNTDGVCEGVGVVGGEGALRW